MTRLTSVLLLSVVTAIGGYAGAQETVTSPNAHVPYVGLHGVFTIDTQELAARDPRNPKRVVFTELTTASFFDDVDGKKPIARQCRYAYRGAAGDPYYYPERSSRSIWELLQLTAGEENCRKFAYLIVRAPHGDPIHMHPSVRRRAVRLPKPALDQRSGPRG